MIGRGVAVGQVEDLVFGNVDEVIGVHYDPVILAEKTELLRLQGARGNLCEGYLLEGLLHVGERGGARVHRR